MTSKRIESWLLEIPGQIGLAARKHYRNPPISNLNTNALKLSTALGLAFSFGAHKDYDWEKIHNNIRIQELAKFKAGDTIRVIGRWDMNPRVGVHFPWVPKFENGIFTVGAETPEFKLGHISLVSKNGAKLVAMSGCIINVEVSAPTKPTVGSLVRWGNRAYDFMVNKKVHAEPNYVWVHRNGFPLNTYLANISDLRVVTQASTSKDPVSTNIFESPYHIFLKGDVVLWGARIHKYTVVEATSPVLKIGRAGIDYTFPALASDLRLYKPSTKSITNNNKTQTDVSTAIKFFPETTALEKRKIHGGKPLPSSRRIRFFN